MVTGIFCVNWQQGSEELDSNDPASLRVAIAWHPPAAFGTSGVHRPRGHTEAVTGAQNTKSAPTRQTNFCQRLPLCLSCLMTFQLRTGSPDKISRPQRISSSRHGL
jgi:hypothetical protein